MVKRANVILGCLSKGVEVQKCDYFPYVFDTDEIYTKILCNSSAAHHLTRLLKNCESAEKREKIFEGWRKRCIVTNLMSSSHSASQKKSERYLKYSVEVPLLGETTGFYRAL